MPVNSPSRREESLINPPSARIAQLDYARAIAIALVAVCHCSELASHVAMTQQTLLTQLMFSVLFPLGRFGVPLFLFLTGALILGKDFSEADAVSKFYRRNLLPLFLTVEVWNCLYWAFASMQQGAFEPVKLLKYLLFLEQPPVINIWYMPMILGMYLALPFVAVVVQKFDIKTLLLPFTIVCICAYLPSRIVIHLNWQNFSGFYINTSFLGGEYGAYIVAGYWLFRREALRWMPRPVCVVVVCAGICLTVAQQFSQLRAGNNYAVWYTDAILAITAVFTFELILRSRVMRKRVAFVESLSRLSLGVFFVHIIPIVLLSGKLDFGTGALPYVLTFVLLFAVSLSLSWGIAAVVAKFPRLARVLFDIRPAARS